MKRTTLVTRRCHQTTYVTCHMYHMFVLSRKPAKRLGCGLFCKVGEIRGSGFSGSAGQIGCPVGPFCRCLCLLIPSRWKRRYFLHLKKEREIRRPRACIVQCFRRRVSFCSSLRLQKSIAICSHTVLFRVSWSFYPLAVLCCMGLQTRQGNA